MDFYANNDLPNFNYVLFHYRRSKIVWPNEKEDIFVLISNDLLYGSLRFVKRSLYDSLRFRLSVLSEWHFLFKHIKCSYEGYLDPQNSQDGSFETRMWDLIVSVPDHCLSFYFTVWDRLVGIACFPFKVHVLISFLFQVMFSTKW